MISTLKLLVAVYAALHDPVGNGESNSPLFLPRHRGRRVPCSQNDTVGQGVPIYNMREVFVKILIRLTSGYWVLRHIWRDAFIQETGRSWLPIWRRWWWSRHDGADSIDIDDNDNDNDNDNDTGRWRVHLLAMGIRTSPYCASVAASYIVTGTTEMFWGEEITNWSMLWWGADFIEKISLNWRSPLTRRSWWW